MTIEGKVCGVERDVSFYQTRDAAIGGTNERPETTPEQPVVNEETVGVLLGRLADRGLTEIDGCGEAGDLAGVASRYEGLKLEQQMLYPRNAKAKVSVTSHNGKISTGALAFQDEFTIALKDASGAYRSWPVRAITFQIDNPVEAHVTALSRYSDEAIHDVFAYIQTLK